MRKSRVFVLSAVFAVLVCSTNAFAGRYYIDCEAGSDSSSGTSQTAAWLHHPYMSGFKGKYSHAAGDQFYFKGGVTCPNSYFPLTVAAGGSASASDYYGPDPNQSWYNGSAWSRPIMSGGGQAISGNNVMFILGSSQYVTFDNFEIAGMKDNSDNIYQHNVAFLMLGDQQTIENMYFHAWVVTGATHDDLVWIQGCGDSCSQQNTVVSQNYCNGADATPPSTSDSHGSSECIRYLNGTIKNNVMLNVSNGIVTGDSTGHYNVVVDGNDCGHVYLSYDSSNHENCIEILGSGQSGNVLANNKVHDLDTGAVWPFVFGPTGAGTDWVFNNVCWNVAKDCYDIDDTAGNMPNYTANIYNNTGQVGSGNYCVASTDRSSGNVIGAVNVYNNHCITPNGTTGDAFCFSSLPSCDTVTNLKVTTNVVMSATTAKAQGYSWSNTFAYAPTDVSGSTVGAGTNLAASCSSEISSLCSDTMYSCSVGPGSALSCPARTPNPRALSGKCTVGVSGCWDAGAYLFQSGPIPPTSLQAIVQ